MPVRVRKPIAVRTASSSCTRSSLDRQRRGASLATCQIQQLKYFRCAIVGPDSSYSCFEIHICWKVDSDDRIDPPIHTEYLRSGGAMTLIFIVDGASAVSSFVIRSPIPPNMVVPPDKTTFA